MRDLQRDSAFPRRARKLPRERFAELGKFFVNVFFAKQFFQRGDARRKRHGMSAERSRLINAAERSHAVHDFGASAESSDGKPAADDFSQTNQVRSHVVHAHRPLQGNAEARHDFVENEKRAVSLCERAQLRKKTRLRHDETDVAEKRFDDNCGDFVPVFRKKFFRRIKVVVGQNKSVRRRARRYAEAVGLPESHRARTGFHEKRIDVSVVASGEFHDFFAARRAARKADSGHRRLGAGVGHADFFDGGNDLRNQFRHADFRRCVRAETQAAIHGGVNGGADFRIVVPENRRSPRQNVIDKFVPVGRKQAATARALRVKRLHADVAKRADRGIHSAGNEFLRASEKFGRFGKKGGHFVKNGFGK